MASDNGHQQHSDSLLGSDIALHREVESIESIESNEQLNPFHLVDLEYSYNALEPMLDQPTLEWHYLVYHAQLVSLFNQEIRTIIDSGAGARLEKTLGTPERVSQFGILENLLSRISRFSPLVRHLAGGHWNHCFFWSSMTDKKENQELSPELQRAFDRSFTSFEEFENRFVEASVRHIGSGWIWLLDSGKGKLQIVTTDKNDNPLMDLVDARGNPLLVCDLWEHAYHLKYRERRDEYVRKFLRVVDWRRVQLRLGGRRH